MPGDLDRAVRRLEEHIDSLAAELRTARTALQGLQQQRGDQTRLQKDQAEQIELLRRKVAEASRDLDSGYRRRRAEIRNRLTDLLQRLETL
jgi:predicted  nucleic acid-binding Zn-ribbon protein